MIAEQKIMVPTYFFSLLSSENSSVRNVNPLSIVGKMVATCVTVSLLAAGGRALADDPPKSPEDLQREALSEEFTQREKSYNYPDLFQKAGQEFGVPPKILEGLSFAETRWEQLKWPPGETVSPENGMP